MSAVLARNWWAVALRGVAGIIFGLIALIVPVAAMLTLALLFAAYLVVDGVFGIVAAVRAAQHHERWGLLLAEGILNLLMGVIVYMFPGGAVLAFVLITAAWALITGGLMLVSSFRLHGAHGRIWLALGGIVSLIWGVLLVLAPMVGAVVLTWWLGVYALVFGVMLLVLGFRLRARHGATGGGLAPGRA
ncbi:MAG: HdeD family acid-resistance protein [Acetobacteraceae bacterium]|nr:HdeD family acid-resistance protein [Acetobacteraceae bacterium]